MMSYNCDYYDNLLWLLELLEGGYEVEFFFVILCVFMPVKKLLVDF